MRSERFQDPVQMDQMCKIAIRIKATEQLNGIIDTLMPSWPRTSRSGWRACGRRSECDPAWICIDVLVGGALQDGSGANGRPVPHDQIDYPAFYDWAAVCDAQGYTYNAVHDFRSTVAEVLHDIAAAGRATPHRKGALYSILRDTPQTIPVQHLTPRNSWGFSATKAFPEPPHALKVRYVSPAVDWQQDEQLVFDDGYTEVNATRYEVFELFGITDAALAWRHGRYFLASAKLRPERYTLTLDIENLVATRGDLVRDDRMTCPCGAPARRAFTTSRHPPSSSWTTSSRTWTTPPGAWPGSAPATAGASGRSPSATRTSTRTSR